MSTGTTTGDAVSQPSVNAITKADIISFMNASLELSEDSDSTEFDMAIEMTLVDMSNRNLLVDTDDTQDLEASDQYLDKPTGYRAVICIQLTHTDSSKLKEPLVCITGGIEEYRQLMAESSSNSTPDSYAEGDEYLYIYPPANADYSAKIEYFKDHAKDADNIEFAVEFENCLMYGTAFHYALLKRREVYINIWGPKYDAELALRRSVIKLRYPYITRDY